MTRDSNTHTESQVTADADTARSWMETHTLVPVRRTDGEEPQLDVVPEDELGRDHEQLDWTEFERELREREMLVVRSGDSAEDIDVVGRSGVVSRATVESEAVEDALMEGETVESEITERRVVEHVVVEAATVESEVVEREIVHSDVVDVALETTDVEQCAVTRAEPPAETRTDLTWFQPGTHLEAPYDVSIAVEERWAVTRGVVERLTIESRIVDSDAGATGTVDVEGVTEAVLYGELVESPAAAADAVEDGRIESRLRENDVIETHLLRRQTIDEELTVGKEITGDVSDAEVLAAEAVSHTVADSEIVEGDEYGVDLAATVAAAETTSPPDATADTGPAAEESAAAEPESTDAGVTEPAADDSVRVTPRPDDEGKTVVNPDGESVGMVVDVDDGGMYVNPHPSVTDRIRTVLGWGDRGEDTYLLGTDHIDHIDDDRVVLRMEHEPE